MPGGSRAPRGTFLVCMVTCAERRAILADTLARFAATDWGAAPMLQIDDGTAGGRRARIHATWLKALARAAEASVDFTLILEDDLDFNRHLHHNLAVWAPLRDLGGAVPFFGSLYNADRPALQRVPGESYWIAEPRLAWGGQGVILSRSMARHLLDHWNEETHSAADVRMPRLAARIAPVIIHAPSLVQHVGDRSTWGGPFHQAPDFDRDWRADT